jgi:dTDP-4-amino-4,6-dideoxy-D-galactose acyltransferase
MTVTTVKATNKNGFCQYLSWDSEFFGRRIARATVNRLTEQAVQLIRDWHTAQRIDCLYFLADSSDPETVRLAEDADFHLVDIRLTLDRQIGKLPPGGSAQALIRQSRPDDLSALRSIAGVSHRDSRFYFDKNFPESLCDALYETWIENSVHGFADIVLVAVVRSEVVGYISCHLASASEPQIGLFAVAEHARGLGLGKQLVWEGLRWFARNGAREVTVVTQGRNIRGQRLYQSCGFQTRSIQLWYHYWARQAPRGTHEQLSHSL